MNFDINPKLGNPAFNPLASDSLCLFETSLRFKNCSSCKSKQLMEKNLVIVCLKHTGKRDPCVCF